MICLSCVNCIEKDYKLNEVNKKVMCNKVDKCIGYKIGEVLSLTMFGLFVLENGCDSYQKGA